MVMETVAQSKKGTMVTVTVYRLPDGSHVAHTNAPGKIISEPPGGIYVFDVKGFANTKADIAALRQKAKDEASSLGIEVATWK